jgi:Cd2+/Zn2+-exporting ATPase
VRALARLTPDEEIVRRDGTERLVPVDEISVGEIVVVRPGERLAIDGVIVEGETTINEAPVTGEGVPVEKGPDDTVFSGSLNGSGGLLVRVSRKAEDSTLQRIARLVEEAQAKRPPSSSSWTVSRASTRPWWWPWRSR